MQFTRMLIFIVLGVYLISIGLMLSAINLDLSSENKINYDGTGNIIPQSETNFYLVNNISDLPLWFNMIFIALPFTIFVLIGITFFSPIGDAGG